MVSPPLVVAAYAVLRNDELEPYRGRNCTSARPSVPWPTWRSGACSRCWFRRGVITGELWIWLFVAPPFVLAGGLFALATLDLDFGDCLFHYGFYLLATVILRWAAGMKWVWDVTS